MSAWAKLGLAVMLGCAMGTASAGGAAPVTQVDIRNFAFAPNNVTVAIGTRVTWTNRDDEPHRITSAGNQFEPSHALDTGDSYEVTFSKPGTYAYFCSIHPMMVGTITVK